MSARLCTAEELSVTRHKLHEAFLRLSVQGDYSPEALLVLHDLRDAAEVASFYYLADVKELHPWYGFTFQLEAAGYATPEYLQAEEDARIVEEMLESSRRAKAARQG